MRASAIFGAEKLQATSAEFRFNTQSWPFLEDHGFQGMTVLPGSLFVSIAIDLHAVVFKEKPGIVRNIRFLSPVILGSHDTEIQATFRDEQGVVQYEFFELSAKNARRPVATLEIPVGAVAVGIKPDLCVSDIQARSERLSSAELLYERLAHNGNYYGPSFRRIASIWRTDHEVLGRISADSSLQLGLVFRLHPILLDAFTQLMAPFMSRLGETFVLRSIDQIDLFDLNFSDETWGQASLTQASQNGSRHFSADIRVFDDAERQNLAITGVTFDLLTQASGLDSQKATKFVVASNFTAEPIEDSLRFWGNYFETPVEVQFTPYNQVFQQLLDPASTLKENESGANFIVIQLEQWGQRSSNNAPKLMRKKTPSNWEQHKRFVLPNGIKIAHLNSYETEYVYKEIFEDRSYLRNGIRLSDSATIIDIGANIGLFSLFVMESCRNPKIFAYEPAPAAYAALATNLEAYGDGSKAFNLGVSDHEGHATFTFYENSSVFSGFFSEENEDRESIQAVVRNMLEQISVPAESVENYVGELSEERLKRTTHDCLLTTVSSIIRENRIEKIDLLKIDAEKSEIRILEGIEAQDWRKIDQIVMEIHDRSHATVQAILAILEEKGFDCAINEEELLQHSGLVNLYASRLNAGDNISDSSKTAEDTFVETLQRNSSDFVRILRHFSETSRTPLLLCFSPQTPSTEADADRRLELERIERELVAETAQLPNVTAISAAKLLQRYPVKDCYDATTDVAGHVPYTQECYAAMGTSLFRAWFDRRQSPYKVIVLDCDNTLWKGVCGEDGAAGIEVSQPYQELQEFMLAQMKAGILLCLCSKNNEQDVLDVFDSRVDMPLKREHLVGLRLNWKSKSENLHSLAQELSLGLDSFIFVDDNPVECAEVRLNCPEVLTLQLPADASAIPLFLNHVWAFDQEKVTHEDGERTRLYQENAEREQFREKTVSLESFIDGLEVRIAFAAPQPEDIGRVSQLTQRTNQFNFTTIRRSESEVREFLEQQCNEGLVIRVSDRFGDYGQVGVVLYTLEEQLVVDTLLLSCRVLGRGVEHAVLREIGNLAKRNGLEYVQFNMRHTEKNLPAVEFLKSLKKEPNSSGVWQFSGEELCSLVFRPLTEPNQSLRDFSKVAPERSKARVDTARLQNIADELFTVDAICKAAARECSGIECIGDIDISANGDPRTVLKIIWQKVLGKSKIGLDDNFFEAGGSSLKAVQLIAMIKKELGKTLPIATVFEYPTLGLLTAKTFESVEAQSQTRALEALQRGQQRRYKIARTPGR